MRRRVYNEHSVLTQERRTPRFNEVEKDLLDMACNNNHRDNLTYKQNDEHEIIIVRLLLLSLKSTQNTHFTSSA